MNNSTLSAILLLISTSGLTGFAVNPALSRRPTTMAQVIVTRRLGYPAHTLYPSSTAASWIRHQRLLSTTSRPTLASRLPWRQFPQSRTFSSTSTTQSNPFAKLGLQKTATQEEINAAYHKLVKKYHPDINKNPDARAKFEDITQARKKALQIAQEAAKFAAQGSPSSQTTSSRTYKPILRAQKKRNEGGGGTPTSSNRNSKNKEQVESAEADAEETGIVDQVSDFFKDYFLGE